jgi:hypothetical protein
VGESHDRLVFTPMEVFTTPTAARLVSFAGVAAGQRLLDVGCGTKLVAQYKNEPDKLRSTRAEFDALISEYFDRGNNVMRRQFLMTKARKV